MDTGRHRVGGQSRVVEHRTRNPADGTRRRTAPGVRNPHHTSRRPTPEGPARALVRTSRMPRGSVRSPRPGNEVGCRPARGSPSSDRRPRRRTPAPREPTGGGAHARHGLREHHDRGRWGLVGRPVRPVRDGAQPASAGPSPHHARRPSGPRLGSNADANLRPLARVSLGHQPTRSRPRPRHSRHRSRRTSSMAPGQRHRSSAIGFARLGGPCPRSTLEATSATDPSRTRGPR